MPEARARLISAQFVMRLLIVSYFVALSLGLIQGAEMQRVADPFLPANLAHYAMRALVLTLCGMILFDVYRRVAALVLSVFVFWSSYLAIFLGGDIGDFWLNLALIGGLLHIGDVGGSEAVNPEAATTRDEAEPEKPAERTAGSRPAHGGELPYRKDFEVVRDL